MDLVIKRLSSIEEASAGIIEAAENEKKALEQQMRERIQAFDEEAEKATQEKLDQIRSSLNEEMQKSLADLQKATEDSIQAIENDYNQNHEKLAAGLIAKMIEEKHSGTSVSLQRYSDQDSRYAKEASDR